MNYFPFRPAYLVVSLSMLLAAPGCGGRSDIDSSAGSFGAAGSNSSGAAGSTNAGGAGSNAGGKGGGAGNGGGGNAGQGGTAGGQGGAAGAGGAPVRCGDGVCAPSESNQTCPIDCKSNCGNRVCEVGELRQTALPTALRAAATVAVRPMKRCSAHATAPRPPSVAMGGATWGRARLLVPSTAVSAATACAVLGKIARAALKIAPRGRAVTASASPTSVRVMQIARQSVSPIAATRSARARSPKPLSAVRKTVVLRRAATACVRGRKSPSVAPRIAASAATAFVAQGRSLLLSL